MAGLSDIHRVGPFTLNLPAIAPEFPPPYTWDYLDPNVTPLES